MKQTILLFMILITGVTFGQSNIDGIGIFKVGKSTTAIIDSIAKNLKIKPELCNDYMLICKATRMNKKYILEPSKTDVMNYPMIENQKKYFIGNYEVSGLKIPYMELLFFNNVLYKIIVDTPDIFLIKALESKYNFKSDEQTTEITCNSIYGQSRFQESKFYKIFRDDKIYSDNIIEEWYDEKCKKNLNTKFQIFEKDTENTVEKLYEVQYKKNREKFQEDSKIKYQNL